MFVKSLTFALIFALSESMNIHRGGYGYEQLGLSGASAYGLNDGSVYGLDLGSFGFSGAINQSPGPLSAAIQTRRSFSVIPVNLPQEPVVPHIIEVEASEQPIQIIFRSISSPVQVKQIHTPGAPGHSEATHSEDEPHRVLHQVFRPVIQEIREVIQPYRRVTQEVRPVLEEVHTVVAKGENRYKQSVLPIAPTISNDAESLSLADDYSDDGSIGSRGQVYGLNTGLSSAYKSAKRSAK